MVRVHNFAVAGLVLLAACAPQPVDRVSLDAPGTASGSGGSDGVGGAGGMGALPGGNNTGGMNSRAVPGAGSPDAAVASVPDAAVSPPDAAFDLAPERVLRPAAYLLVGDPSMLQPSDTALRDLLEGRMNGAEVDLIDDDEPEYLSYAKLVVISGSCAPDALGLKYRNATVGVVALDSRFLPNLGITTNEADVSFGVQADSQAVTILNRMHPLAAGLSGTVDVFAARGGMSWGSAGTAAIRIAHVAGQASHLAIFAYNKGAVTPGGTTPGKRVAFFADAAPAAQLSDAGVRLLEAAIDWAAVP